jgi:PAS domain-containing protein
MNQFLLDFSELIKHYRHNLGLTQQETAHQAGISLRSYQRIESGETEPTISQAHRLCSILGFNAMEIFRFENEVGDEQRVLRQSVKFLEQVNEVSRVGGWEIDLATNKITWTEMCRKIIEVPPDYVPEFDAATNFWKEGISRDTVLNAVYKCIADGTPYDLELAVITTTGKELTVITRGRAEMLDGKVIKVFGTIQDVTSLREIEKALKAVQEENQFLNENSMGGTWKMDIKQNQITWSKSLLKIFEVEDKGSFTFEEFISLIHPEDRERLRQIYMQSLVSRHPYEFMHRALMPNGRLKIILVHGYNFYDSNGEAYLARGHAIDVTRFHEKGFFSPET